MLTTSLCRISDMHHGWVRACMNVRDLRRVRYNRTNARSFVQSWLARVVPGTTKVGDDRILIDGDIGRVGGHRDVRNITRGGSWTLLGLLDWPKCHSPVSLRGRYTSVENKQFIWILNRGWNKRIPPIPWGNVRGRHVRRLWECVL